MRADGDIEGMTTGYQWFRTGDLNGFFALMFDNVANLVILASILTGAFGFPSQIVLYRMIPGTAIGVLAGDLFYAWMAGRLAKQTGRNDVTAMPLGLNAPSIFGMSFGVLGPAYLATHDAYLAWKMGMAVTVLVGIFKVALSFGGNAVRRAVPRAALLGSIGGAGLALIALLPMLKMYANPIPGLLAFGVILVSLVGNVKIPGKIPGALASALVGIAAFHLLRTFHVISPIGGATSSGIPGAFHLSFPWPTMAFLSGLSLAWAYLPIILPFSLATVVGGIDNTESAAAAGDVYDTSTILLTEGLCTVLAGLCGGVVESTPYIGHPAYKAMGAGAGYTILTGLFIGLGGIFGYLPFFVAWIPAAAIAPILVYIGLEVISQAFLATPSRHGLAVAVSLLPSLAFLIGLEVTSALGAVGAHPAQLTGDVGETIRTVILVGNGFIISAVVWGAATAELLDHRFGRSAGCLVVGALACLFGVIHSPMTDGTFVLPWRAGSLLPWHFAIGYLAAALVIFISRYFPHGDLDTEH
jgi:AGZA family xanthine/uracil permease-like MFS transporter